MAADPIVCGVPITHADRVIYPEAGVTKLDLARYYESIARWIVPHLRGRPLTLVHCPTGVGGSCRYLRHGKAWGPRALRRVRIRERTKIGEYLVADTSEALLSLAQLNMLELHTWNSCTDRIEQPDRLVFDLDPGPETGWPEVVAAARLLRRVLQAMDLECWVKTTGGRGLHLVVPLKPERDWSECLTFARGVAQMIERGDPDRFTTAFRKQGRERQILIDYLRNNRTNTSIAAFSTRARPQATVSVPLRWTELTRRLDPARLTIRTVAARFTRLRLDPWKDYWTARQRISSAALRAVSRA